VAELALWGPKVRFPYRGRQQSGEHVEFKPATVYEISHAVQVWGEAGARALADELHGRFKASYVHEPGDSLALGLDAVTLLLRGVPDARTVERARKAIDEAIAEIGVKALYQGYQRFELGPADAPRKPWLRDDPDDDDPDHPAAMPLPQRS
jgi:hypothetical protein